MKFTSFDVYYAWVAPTADAVPLVSSAKAEVLRALKMGVTQSVIPPVGSPSECCRRGSD